MVDLIALMCHRDSDLNSHRDGLSFHVQHTSYYEHNSETLFLPVNNSTPCKNSEQNKYQLCQQLFPVFTALNGIRQFKTQTQQAGR